MGTRADFYVGKGKDAEWIGSIAFDGYRSEIDHEVRAAKSEEEFRAAVGLFFSGRDDATRPDQGWPWPWNDSSTTDCSYWFFDGCCWEDDGGFYRRCDDLEPDAIEYPDMSGRKNFTLGTRSGGIVFAAEANASLIASAPELYEALRIVTDIYWGVDDDHAGDGGEPPEGIKQARATLAKARGEAA